MFLLLRDRVLTFLYLTLPSSELWLFDQIKSYEVNLSFFTTVNTIYLYLASILGVYSHATHFPHSIFTLACRSLSVPSKPFHTGSCCLVCSKDIPIAPVICALSWMQISPAQLVSSKARGNCRPIDKLTTVEDDEHDAGLHHEEPPIDIPSLVGFGAKKISNETSSFTLTRAVFSKVTERLFLSPMDRII